MNRQFAGETTGHNLIMQPLKRAALWLVLACAALGGCETRITASATSNVPTQFSHVYITVEQVWLNASGTAGPDEAGWLKYSLPDPKTLDLVGLTNGTLSAFASDVPAPAGTYKQIRLILSDTSAALTESADSAGISFNNEVDYFDSNGVAQERPLAVPNFAQGVGIPIELNVLTSSDALLAALAGGSSSSTSTDTGTNSGIFSAGDGTTTTTSTTSTTSTSTAASDGTGTITAKVVLVFNAARDLVPFTYSGQQSYVLNASLTGTDIDDVGTISSQLDVSGIAVETSTSRAEIQVTAQIPSADGTRNIPVLSAPVKADGTFVLYPFPTLDDSPTTYDLVFHGPRVQTLIIKAVPVSQGAPSSASTVSLGNIALSAATAYSVNVADPNTATPRGARVGFYQTLPGTGELPYLIEERAIDPVSGLFFADQLLPSSAVLVGTYSGSAPVLTSVSPTEGTGAFRVAASAPVYTDGVLGDLNGAIVPPLNTATTVTFEGPTLDVPSTSTSSTITATVSVTTPAKYDNGVIVLTHDGGLVSVVPLSSATLALATDTVTFSAVPGGSTTQTFDSAVYYAEVWVWNSTDPATTFNRQPSSTVIDLRAASTATASLTIN